MVRDTTLVRVCLVPRLFRDNHPAAEELRKVDKNLTLMVQSDMIAYHEPGEPAQLGLPIR